MRYLAACGLLLAASAFAGEVDVRGTTAGRVSVHVNAAPLSEVLDRLARQTGMKVVYDGPPPRAVVRGRQVEDVTVTVGPGPAAGTLVGLVLVAGAEPQALDGRTIRLIPLDRATLSSSMDDLGNFEFEAVPAGLYALEIDLPDAQVIVEELRLD